MCAMCLCANRFRLGWAHDAFLHVTCSRNSHAYVPSFQYIWYYWCCLRLFWLSFLFLPLFLFTLVVSMALKHKSIPARNPLRSSASSSSIPGGSIENAPASSTASRHLVDRLSFCSWNWFFVARYLPDTLAIDDQFLDIYLNSSSIPPDTSAVEHYWGLYIFFHCDSSLISSISLNLSATVHFPNTLIFTPNLFLKDSSSFFKFLFTW